MLSLVKRFRALIACSLALQLTLGALLWWSPSTLPGSNVLAMILFPGMIFAWSAIHGSLPIGIATIVLVNVAYHVVLGVIVAAVWRAVHPAA